MRIPPGVGKAASDDKPSAAEGAAAEGADAATTVMRPPTAADTPGPDAVTGSSAQSSADEVPGSDDNTVTMRIVPDPTDAQTMALPIHVPPNDNVTEPKRTAETEAKSAGTDRVVPPTARATPLSKPPSTPRPAQGPKQPAPQAPSAPPQHPPGPAEETRPAQQQARQVASEPSPADINATRTAQTLAGPRPPQPRPIAAPQRIIPPGKTAVEPGAPTTGRSQRRLVAISGAAVLVIALIAAVATLIATSGDDSPQVQIRAVITDYIEGLRDGDLATLRSATCGPLHDFYQGIQQDQFASVHQLSVERKNIPVVESIDAIRITDDTALAQATVYTEADPGKRSARTFDLQHANGGWKVCDPPTGTP